MSKLNREDEMNLLSYRKEMSIKIFTFCILLVGLLGGAARGQPKSTNEIFTFLAANGWVKGAEKAPITLIEFSDFQCSFCRKFWQRTLPKIEKKYIHTGKIKFVYSHFALLGKHSVAAALAAECAGELGKFWPYHDLLFSRATSFLAFSDKKLEAYAREMGLESEKFSRCFNSDRYLEKVKTETSIAALLGARGTPTFFLNGRLIVGAQPFKVFSKVIEEELEKRRK